MSASDPTPGRPSRSAIESGMCDGVALRTPGRESTDDFAEQEMICRSAAAFRLVAIQPIGVGGPRTGRAARSRVPADGISSGIGTARPAGGVGVKANTTGTHPGMSSRMSKRDAGKQHDRSWRSEVPCAGIGAPSTLAGMERQMAEAPDHKASWIWMAFASGANAAYKNSTPHRASMPALRSLLAPIDRLAPRMDRFVSAGLQAANRAKRNGRGMPPPRFERHGRAAFPPATPRGQRWRRMNATMSAASC